ncbi:H-NS family histone-like protein [Basfia succiniciproducens]|uniref:DNA-binding protein n=1 Tax=Mannheimia succiniciproducens (strain KCTC 0769BP / MBEL55E) TaxID=221988 RepID=Q65SY1_MANSM|nr:H-NS family nucleoid-associated regulatory protein [[Mannheimia] succiniciproducens]AAU37929.1 Hns protein [[Mannheimia] succiniciproducens MBEL55E]
MNEVIKTLNNLRRLRSMAKELSIEQLENIIEKFQLVIEEKKAEELEIKRLEEERKNRLEKYRELLKEDGITADELAQILAGKNNTAKAKRAPLSAKYKYINENGEQKTWTGQGRMPKAIQLQLNAGKSLSDFAI